MDNLTKQQRRKNMQAIRSKGTKAEVLLGKSLWSKGIRYRKNNPKIYGRPDFTISKYRIAIFCDGEFWHGKNWNKTKSKIKSNTDYWLNKIENNIKRDKIVNRVLKKEGWIIIRLWVKDIESNCENCTQKVIEKINELRNP